MYKILFCLFGVALIVFAVTYLVPYFKSNADVASLENLTLYRIDPERETLSDANLQNAPHFELSPNEIEETFGSAQRAIFLPFWKGSYFGIGRAKSGSTIRFQISVTNGYFEVMGDSRKYVLGDDAALNLRKLYNRNFIKDNPVQ